MAWVRPRRGVELIPVGRLSSLLAVEVRYVIGLTLHGAATFFEVLRAVVDFRDFGLSGAVTQNGLDHQMLDAGFMQPR